MASVLPRSIEEVIIDVKDMYASRSFNVGIKRLRLAIEYLCENHPGFKDIEVSEAALLYLERLSHPSECAVDEEIRYSVSETEPASSAAETVRNAGQNQTIKNDTAQLCLTAPLAIEVGQGERDLKRAIEDLFRLISKRTIPVKPGSSSEGWELMFPWVLPNGCGGPSVHRHVPIYLRY